MRYRIIIEYSTDESPEVYDSVHDNIFKMLSALPYMVDNVNVELIDVDEDEEM